MKIKFLPMLAGITGMLLIELTAVSSYAVTPSLSDLINEARKNNPRIQEAYNRWKEAEYKTVVAGSLEDPTASYGFFGDEVQTRVGPQEQKFGLSQKLPFPGKLSLKSKAQQNAAYLLEERYKAAIQEVEKSVQLVYYDLYWVDKNLQISDEEKDVLDNLIKVVQRKYESNQAAQKDVIKSQVELSKVIEREYLLQSQRSGLVSNLNYLLGRQEDVAVPAVLDIERRSFDHDLESVLSAAKTSRQELKAAGYSVKKSEYEKQLADMGYLPDFMLGFDYIEVGDGTTRAADDGKDAWMGMVSVNVPIWFEKIQSTIKEKEVSLEAAKAYQEDAGSQVRYEIQQLYNSIEAYKDIVSLYETALLPQAEQAFDASQIGFETGSVTFLDWLESERTFLKTRIAYCKAVTDFHKTLVMLERAAGEKL